MLCWAALPIPPFQPTSPPFLHVGARSRENGNHASGMHPRVHHRRRLHRARAARPRALYRHRIARRACPLTLILKSFGTGTLVFTRLSMCQRTKPDGRARMRIVTRTLI
eukprot:2316765-Pleurochrysis_carterae.AAC.2